MQLDLFTVKIEEEKLHPKFELLRRFPHREQKILQRWTENFIDRDNKIVEEFQKNFHSSFWEFYLYAVFTEMGFTIDFSKNTPDFIIQQPERILVEAVAAEIKKDGRPEQKRTSADFAGNLIPPHRQTDFYQVLDEAITRYSNSIHKKHAKYDKYKETGDEPFVVALGSFDQVNYGTEYIYPLMALLYGMYFTPLEKSYAMKSSIKKPETDVDIPLGLFRDDRYKNISAILFSCTTTLGKLTSLANSSTEWSSMNHVTMIRHDYEKSLFSVLPVFPENPESLSDGLFLFHNPHAKNKLDINIFGQKDILQITIVNNEPSFIGNKPPIYRRHSDFLNLTLEQMWRVTIDFNSKPSIL